MQGECKYIKYMHCLTLFICKLNFNKN